MPNGAADPGPRRDVRVARKEYPCSGAHGRPCRRRIHRGDPYTQISYAPYQKPFTRSPIWTILRVCAACEPIPESEARTSIPCPRGTATDQCTLPAGHSEPCSYLQTLF